MKALITGGAGFIGSHLAEALLEQGYHVTIIDNLSTGRFENIAHLTDHPSFRFAIDTITNEVVMDRLVSECNVILHLAAAVGVELIVKDPVRVIETNILGTHAVLKVANRYRKRVLLASTSEIYGKNNHVPFREDDDRLLGPTTKARWSYSTSKAVDEFLGLAYHRQMGLPVVIFRLFNTVGPRQTGRYGMVVPRFVQQALTGESLTVYGDGQQTRCFCNVEDAVRAIIGLAECPEAVGQVFNIGSTEEVTILELAERVLGLVDAGQGSKGAEAQRSKGELRGESPPTIRNSPLHPGTSAPRLRFVPYDQAYEVGFEDMRRRVPDISKIKAMIGWEPQVTLEETLRHVITHFAEAEEQ
jgi:UDP-glucose 4-epimerase